MGTKVDDLELENNLFFSFMRQYVANNTHRCRALYYLCVSSAFLYWAAHSIIDVYNENSQVVQYPYRHDVAAVLFFLKDPATPFISLLIHASFLWLTRQEAQLPQRDSASATHVFLGSLTDRALHWAPHLFYNYILD